MAGLVGGPALAAVCFALLPSEYEDVEGQLVAFSIAGRLTLTAMVWMGVWWLTEAIDIAATALLPLALFPLMGITPDFQSAATPYADKLIFLFMGGFILSLAMQRWGLGRRIALLVLRVVGDSPRMMVAAFMGITAVFSAFVSNTATAAMMLPIAVSVIDLVRKQHGGETLGDGPVVASSAGGHFALCLVLGIAYAASIGGIATIIGTPPNAFLVGFVTDADKIGEEHVLSIGFAEWLKIGLPLVVVFLPLTWLLLTRVLYPIRIGRIEGGGRWIDTEIRRLGKAHRGEWATFIVFTLTATAWITRPLYDHVVPVSDYGIAMIASLALFLIPVDLGRGEFVMNWRTAERLPWSILVLFGGGLSLASAVRANHVAEFIGARATLFEGAPPLLVVVVVAAGVIFLTELTSNTATTAALVPVLAAIAPGMGVHPYLLIFPAGIAASCAFMMPVATPPNAIIFGSGHVTVPQMCRAGLWLNLLGVALVTLLTRVLLGGVLGVDLEW